MRIQYTRLQRGARLRIAGPVLMPVLILLLSALFLAGCASRAAGDGAPKGYRKPIEPLYNNGKTINRVRSWQPIASDVAASVRKALEDRPDLMDKPIFIPPPSAGPFSMVFFNLLKTELVSRGLQVANSPEANNVDLNFSLYRVRNDSSTRRPFDVVIVARMLYHNRYVMYKSGVYFIPEEASRIFVTTDRGFVGGNFASGDPGQQEVDSLWQHYAMRAQVSCPPELQKPVQPAHVARPARQAKPVARNTAAPRSNTDIIIINEGPVKQEEINISGGRRIDPNAPAPDLSAFRSQKR